MIAVTKKQNYGPDVAVSVIVRLHCGAGIRATRTGEVNFHCTHLEDLDRSWRMMARTAAHRRRRTQRPRRHRLLRRKMADIVKVPVLQYIFLL
jgi:hypothetical protein